MAEECNGVDDDCDGATDQASPWSWEGSRRRCVRRFRPWPSSPWARSARRWGQGWRWAPASCSCTAARDGGLPRLRTRVFQLLCVGGWFNLAEVMFCWGLGAAMLIGAAKGIIVAGVAVIALALGLLRLRSFVGES